LAGKDLLAWQCDAFLELKSVTRLGAYLFGLL
jgi:hypothetical protein